ncbi:shikimate dehydrogenase [Ovoidimarina sediminis]|uniref:shikimate dehydrogenase n=1 Tax=Ovoidimarina sediminis TaxID=3079856 RepID=UPI002914EC22|nr:shikimate dehydrogenase [Rhodophyticola sp. MJ-SS7]MDU8942532.1 shikimate dehydrogenase [Rhodophyticola sp. MJ-SS7]
MTNNRIPLAGVIGSPVSHSLSPRLHTYWLRRHAIAGYYIPMDIAQEDLPTALKTLPMLGFVGINVTIPHKVAVLSLADTVTDRASLIGAANTLTWQKDGRLFADNTDGQGFMDSLRAGAPDWTPDMGPAAVIGAGGAARAVLSALIAANVPSIRLTNRTRTRAEALRAEFGNRIEVFDWVQAGNALDGAALIVNTTSLGMTGKPELRIPLDGLSPGSVVLDLVYSPLETRLLNEAREAGCIAVDGLGMLLHQGAPGFERWFGVRPTVDEETRKVVLRQT